MSEPGGFVGLGSAFESPERGKGHEIGDPDASQPALGRKNDPDLGVVVEENLPVPPARADWTSVVVADRDDSGQLAGSGGPGRAERHQLRTGAAGEVVDVHRWEHAAVGRSNSSAHGMDAVLVGTSVGIAVDRLAGKGDELLVLVGELRWSSDLKVGWSTTPAKTTEHFIDALGGWGRRRLPQVKAPFSLCTLSFGARHRHRALARWRVELPSRAELGTPGFPSNRPSGTPTG